MPPPTDSAFADRSASSSARDGTLLTFRGPVRNETLGREGQLSLSFRRPAGAGPVTLRFHASAGLLGTGALTGTISADGQLTATGRLMMGRNPFDCELTARITGDQLAGSASFVRSGRAAVSRSTFLLTRS
jgi:hypothetical protein